MEGVAYQCHGAEEETTGEFNHEADEIAHTTTPSFRILRTPPP